MKNGMLLAAVVALLAASLGAADAQGKLVQFMFINHTNMQLHFYVDEAYECTANAGMVCYSRLGLGPHTFKAAMGTSVVQQTTGTLYANAQSPAWTVCQGPGGACP
ncbi:MAG: hypothetical protein ABSC22_11415 [Roseiarcus sp.]